MLPPSPILKLVSTKVSPEEVTQVDPEGASPVGAGGNPEGAKVSPVVGVGGSPEKAAELGVLWIAPPLLSSSSSPCNSSLGG